MNHSPVEYAHNQSSTNSLFEQVVEKLAKALNDVKSAVDNNGNMHLQKLANTLANGDTGLRLFECNGMLVCLLANGELADTALPFNRGSVLVQRGPDYIVDKYGAKDCLAHLQVAIDKMLDHEIKVLNDNREVVGQPRIDPDLLTKLVEPSN